MKKLLTIVTLMIISLSVFSQDGPSRGSLMMRDTTKYKPGARMVQIIVDSAKVLYWWRGTSWGALTNTGTWAGAVIAGQYGGTGVANTGKTITVSGNTTIGSSTHTVAFVTGANTSVTLPATGTLATLAGSEVLTNKTLTTASIGTATITSKLNITAGANKAIGTATLALGTITVSNTSVTTSSLIKVWLLTAAGTLGVHYVAPPASIVNGTSFVINAFSTAHAVVATDSSTVAWEIIN